MKTAEHILKEGGIGVFPTDTIYGLVGSALKRKTVQRIYRVRKRNPGKPFIILIRSMEDLRRFGVRIDEKTRRLLRRLWPGEVSVILPCGDKKFSYLHRGTKTLAFRMPRRGKLSGIIKAVGPLAAPSANPEGKPPAATIAEARKYFKNKIDFYVDAGRLDSRPSTLIEVQSGKAIILREGKAKVPKKLIHRPSQDQR